MMVLIHVQLLCKIAWLIASMNQCITTNNCFHNSATPVVQCSAAFQDILSPSSSPTMMMTTLHVAESGLPSLQQCAGAAAGLLGFGVAVLVVGVGLAITGTTLLVVLLARNKWVDNNMWVTELTKLIYRSKLVIIKRNKQSRVLQAGEHTVHINSAVSPRYVLCITFYNSS